MKRGILFLMAAICLWLSTAASAWAKVEVTGIYLSTRGDGTIATFTLKGGITRHTLSTLENPYRLVVDIAEGVWNVPGNSVTGKSPLVKSIRSGSPEPGNLRIVIELSGAAMLLSDKRTETTLSLQFAATGNKKPAAEAHVPQKPSAKKPDASNLPKSMRKGYTSGLELPGYEKSIFVKEGAALAQSKPKGRKPVIVIDPGHGGMDPGAISKSGVYEKKVTLSYAKALKELLEASGNYTVYLTRTGDRYIDLAERVKKARAWKADMFLSLHADSHKNPDTRGLSVYTISEDRAQRETNKLYQKADFTEVIRGVDMKQEDKEVQGTLLDLARRANTNTAATFAEMLVKEMGNDAKLLDNTHRQKSLAVLTDIDITSVLIELGYLSNRHEEKQLRTDAYRETLTTGIKNAIDGYFKKFPLQE